MKPSQCDRLLAVLSDGRPHRMEQIHQFIGFCRLNSRVSELRSRGYDIRCDRSGGVYTYQLIGSLGEATADARALVPRDRKAPGSPNAVASPNQPDEQLQMEAA